MINAQTKIMVFGTFDILHPGHLHFFRQARRLARNPFLIVSIARDVNVRNIKGKLPLNNERKRAWAVRKSALADKVILGGIKDYIPHILLQQPHIVALGYDQKSKYTESLKKKIAPTKVVRLRAYRPTVYKSSLFLKNST